MKKLGVIMAIILSFTTFTGCTNQAVSSKTSNETPVTAEASTKTSEEETTNERCKTLKFESKALAGNSIGDTTEKEVYVYLPPSYYETEKSYPVVYFLHGYAEYADVFVFSNKEKLDEAFKKDNKEFILVGVNGLNKLRGSFYVNSPVTGNWEDYVIDEVVPFVDTNFRTLANSESRGICGFSMGGFGAYNLALKHPDVFSSVLMMSPGLLADGDLPSAMQSWSGDMGFKKAYASAFSPSKDKDDNIPELSGTPEDNKIVSDWENGFGNINQKVDTYRALNKPLKGIKIIYGESDYYPWIPKGCEFLAKCLDERQIKYSIESFEGGHTIHPEIIDKIMLPFFNENLEY